MEVVTAPIRYPASDSEFRRIAARAAADPDRAPVLHPATHAELRRIAATWDEREVAA